MREVQANAAQAENIALVGDWDRFINPICASSADIPFDPQGRSADDANEAQMWAEEHMPSFSFLPAGKAGGGALRCLAILCELTGIDDLDRPHLLPLSSRSDRQNQGLVAIGTV